MVRFTGSVPTQCSNNVSSAVIHTATKLFIFRPLFATETALHTRVIIYLDIKAALRVFIQTVGMCTSTCALMRWITCRLPPHMRSTHYGSRIHHFTRHFTDLYGIYVGNVSVLCAKVVLLSRCRANVSQNAETRAPVWFVVVQHVVARRLPLDGERRGSSSTCLRSVCACAGRDTWDYRLVLRDFMGMHAVVSCVLL